LIIKEGEERLTNDDFRIDDWEAKALMGVAPPPFNRQSDIRQSSILVTSITDPLFKVSVSLNTLGKGRTMTRSPRHKFGVL